jgi:hypothetical protein
LVTPNAIPHFITAATPQGLRRVMLLTNARLGAFVTFFDIQQTKVNGRDVWVAWYYAELKNDKDIEDLKGGVE